MNRFRYTFLRSAGTGAEASAAAGGNAAPAASEAPPPSAVTPPPTDPAPKDAAPPADPAAPADPNKPAPPPEAPKALLFADLKIPEVMKDQVKEADFADMLATINDDKLAPGDRANKLIELHAAAMQKAQDQLRADWYADQEKKAAAMATHPEFGGDKYPATQAAWNRVLNEFGSDELRADITNSGIGNSPALGTFLLKIAAALGEGNPTVGAPTSPGSTKSAAQVLYPDLPSRNGA